MSIVAFDFETERFGPGYMAPFPACLALRRGREVELVGSDDDLAHMRAAFARVLSADQIRTFNGAFDFGVALEWMPEFIDPIFDAYREGRVFDSKIFERLGEISLGLPDRHHSLETLCAQYGITVSKTDTPRLEYGALVGVPLSQYAPEEIEYPKQDADAHYRIFDRVAERHGSRVDLREVAKETYYDFALHLSACWGIRTEIRDVDALRRAAKAAIEEMAARASAAGLLTWDAKAGRWKKNSKLLKQRVFDAYEGNPPITKTGVSYLREKRRTHGRRYQLSSEELFKFTSTDKVATGDSGDVELEDFASYGMWSSIISKDVKLFERGLFEPIHTRYSIAATLRTTSSPNFQNFARLPGVRDCVTPREGCCFGFIDVAGLELGTQAQINVWEVGDYRMAEMINGGIDLHMLAASVLEGWDYEWAIARKKEPRIKDTRQLCKIPNFGYPGGMQPAALVPYARRQISPANPKGIQITIAQAEKLYANWRRALSFAYQYTQRTRRINRAPGRDGRFQFFIPGTKVLRGNATYTSACNGKFQSLGARAMKRALARVIRAAWTEPASPLYRIPVPLFIHDELGFEIPIGRQDEVLREANRLILGELSRAMPDVSFSCEYVACDRWSKGAEPTFDDRGRLLVTRVANVF